MDKPAEQKNNLYLFTTGKPIPEGTKISETDVNTIKALDSLKLAVSEGGSRRFFTVILAPDNSVAYLWCNLDKYSLGLVGDAMGRKSVEIDEYLKKAALDEGSGMGV